MSSEDRSVSNDLKSQRNNKGLAVATFLILAPILVIGHRLGFPHQAYWLFCSLAVLTYAGFANWEYRASGRFWLAALALLIAHALVITFIPYPNVRFTAVFIPVFILDFVVSAYIIHWIVGSDPPRDG